MATNTSITTTYAGEHAAPYISTALLSGTTIANGGISVKPNIKYQEVIRILGTDGLVKDATCDYTDTSTITTTERLLTPESFQVNLTLCKSTFRTDWDAISMGYSAFDVLPKNFTDYLIGYAAAKVAQKIEQNIWHGTNATTGEFDGLVPLMTADGTVIDEAGILAMDSTTVIEEMASVVDQIPATLYGDPGLKLYISQSVARDYVRALGGFVATIGGAGTDNKGSQWYDNGALSFEGIPIFVAPGLNTKYMVAAKSDNLWFGTGLFNDTNQVSVLDMADLDGSQNVRIVMRFTGVVNYGIGAECVLYTPV